MFYQSRITSHDSRSFPYYYYHYYYWNPPFPTRFGRGLPPSHEASADGRVRAREFTDHRSPPFHLDSHFWLLHSTPCAFRTSPPHPLAHSPPPVLSPCHRVSVSPRQTVYLRFAVPPSPTLPLSPSDSFPVSPSRLFRLDSGSRLRRVRNDGLGLGFGFGLGVNPLSPLFPSSPSSFFYVPPRRPVIWLQITPRNLPENPDRLQAVCPKGTDYNNFWILGFLSAIAGRLPLAKADGSWI